MFPPNRLQSFDLLQLVWCLRIKPKWERKQINTAERERSQQGGGGVFVLVCFLGLGSPGLNRNMEPQVRKHLKSAKGQRLGHRFQTQPETNKRDY